ncbi:MCE family protein [Solimonas sp. K1W22B-7]|uniref:PqiB family protein n=1 Tax=Solimonas sp. K1W22B-7 TaxID=2303331 RepID=UPI000E32D582|nr:MlaD family protein [Solimonas sp. K1W22B-7]AXQ29584.1 MCE family protein [Solimonas sp. K1W22B-7]
MTESDEGLPEPQVRKPPRWQFSLVWLVPLVAALIGLGLLVRAWTQAGPVITLQFKSAEGLEEGKTQLRFKDVVIGKVRTIDLSKNFSSVKVKVELNKDAARVAVADSRFWVVRPRADLGGVSGLGTLLSGAYIGVDIGQSQTSQRLFQGLEVPPAVTNDRVGRGFRLLADDLGSLNLGSPLYYRRVPVGRIVGYELDKDGRGVSLQAFVDAPYDRFVTPASRFWNASGVDVSVGAQGFKLNTQSLVSVLAGGVAFQSIDNGAQPAAQGTRFRLYNDVAAAMAPQDKVQLRLRLRFYQSVRGLAVGGPVDFHGLQLGEVTAIDFEYDASRQRFAADVAAVIYPERLGNAYLALRAQARQADEAPRRVFERLIAQGMRAQLRSGNLLTGQQYVALEFVPKVESTLAPAQVGALTMPTVPGSFDQIQSQIASIVDKVEKIPFDEIGAQLRDSLRDADQLLKTLDGKVAPEMQQTLEQARQTLGTAEQALASDAPLQQDLRGTLESVDRAARSLRSLTEGLQRHPQSLLRGKPDDPLLLRLSPLPEEGLESRKP